MILYSLDFWIPLYKQYMDDTMKKLYTLDAYISHSKCLFCERNSLVFDAYFNRSKICHDLHRLRSEFCRVPESEILTQLVQT